MLPEVFRTEVCKDFDAREVTKLLLSRKWIKPDSDGTTATRKERLPESPNPVRCYVFTSKMWED